MRTPLSRSKVLIAASLMVGVLGLAASGENLKSPRQSAVVYLTEPTLIGSTVVQGPVLFTHDDTKMLRGEPCTSVYLFEPGRGPAEELASFHCIPRSRQAVTKFTLRTVPNDALGFGCILTEYQFAGDTEGHGVPIAAYAD
jgi:hypothetical protein